VAYDLGERKARTQQRSAEGMIHAGIFMVAIQALKRSFAKE
jgi:hypothetical protein